MDMMIVRFVMALIFGNIVGAVYGYKKAKQEKGNEITWAEAISGLYGEFAKEFARW